MEKSGTLPCEDPENKIDARDKQRERGEICEERWGCFGVTQQNECRDSNSQKRVKVEPSTFS